MTLITINVISQILVRISLPRKFLMKPNNNLFFNIPYASLCLYTVHAIHWFLMPKILSTYPKHYQINHLPKKNEEDESNLSRLMFSNVYPWNNYDSFRELIYIETAKKPLYGPPVLPQTHSLFLLRFAWSVISNIYRSILFKSLFKLKFA